MKRFSLPFDDINDLLKQVEIIKAAQVRQQLEDKSKLDAAGIKYQMFSFGINVDIKGLSKEQLEVVSNLDSKIIKDIYNLVGVVEN